MSIEVFKDKIFPRQVSDIMSLMYTVVFKGTDGEEKWTTYLTPKQKEYVALALAEYYQCKHCIEHHSHALHKLEKLDKPSLSINMLSIVLFLRIDTRTVSEPEKEQWIEAWQRFAKNVSVDTGDQALPHLIGLAIGIARNDEFLIRFCGQDVYRILNEQSIEPHAAIGELEAVVIFMKAAASKNRVVDKIEGLLSLMNG